MNYRDAGRLAEAESLIDEWLPRGRAELGEYRPSMQFGLETAISIHERLGQPTSVEPLRRELAAFWKVNAGAESPQYSKELASLGMFLLQQDKPADAESILREAMLVDEATRADDWTTFNTKSLLGFSLLGQQNYTEAEPLLLSGYEGLNRREKKIPRESKVRLREALQRIVQLYDEWGHKDKAAEWRTKLTGVRSAKPAESDKN